MKAYLYFVIVFFLLLEVYSYKIIKTLTKNFYIRSIWVSISLVLFLFTVFNLISLEKGNLSSVYFVYGAIFISYGVKMILLFLFLLGEIDRFLIKYRKGDKEKKEKSYSSRRKFLGRLALGASSLPFLGFIYGAKVGKFKYTLRKVDISFPNLPEAFNGYRIVQLSDIHVGSFDYYDREKVRKGVELINQQNPDLFVFTGDAVNYIAEEMENWTSVFQGIQAKDGMYSILGNHDYGFYFYGTEVPEKTQKNLIKLEELEASIGWKLLRNEAVKIKKGEEEINLVGLENWGGRDYDPQFADLDKAMKDIDEDFTIVLSHDPSFFDVKIRDYPKKIDLTLAGHTHGMQLGVEIPKLIKWSPARLLYKQWAGLYKEKGRYIYVNRGFGYLGLPARIGIWSEVTVITLHKE